MKQKEIASNPMNPDSSSRIQLEGAWPASHSGGSSKPSSDKRINFVAVQPLARNYLPAIPYWPHGYCHNQVGNGKICENSANCIVFGVDFAKSSNAIAPPEKELGCPTTLPGGPKEIVPVAASETDGNQSPTNVTLKMMQKQVASDASPNEKLNKQVLAPSMRTCTKVGVQLECDVSKIPFSSKNKVTIK